MTDNEKIDVEKIWNLKVEARNNIFNYLDSKGLDEEELLKFVKLLNKYANRAITLSHYI